REWSAAAATYRRVLQDDDSLAPVWYRLGWCLWRLGDAAGAAGALDEACRRGGSAPHWLGLLADAREAAGDLAAAAEARHEVVRLAGDTDPRPRLALANLYARVGQWADAQRVRRDNADRHPHHAATHRRLGEVSLALARWGGSFTGTLAGRDAGGFRFDQPTGEAAATARQALERAAALEPAKTAWREALAEARLADGDLRGAAALYEAALRHADESTGKWVLAVKQRWQFALESIHHRLGAARVEDPLFECTVQAGPTDGEVTRVAGLFSVGTTFGGLTVSGLLAVDDADHVEIVLDGQPVRSLKVGGDGFFPEFHIEIKRSTLALFPAKARLEVRLPDGTPLHTTGGAQSVHLTVPHGDGTLPAVLAAGGKVDKKGTVSLSAEAARQRQDRY